MAKIKYEMPEKVFNILRRFKNKEGEFFPEDDEYTDMPDKPLAYRCNGQSKPKVTPYYGGEGKKQFKSEYKKRMGYQLKDTV